MENVITDLQVKKLQLIDDKFENVRVNEIRLEQSLLIIKFRNKVETFPRKKSKVLKSDSVGDFFIQSDGLKIVIDYSIHKLLYHTFLSYFNDIATKTPVQKNQQLSTQLSETRKEKLQLSIKKVEQRKSHTSSFNNEQQTRLAAFTSSPAPRSKRIKADYYPAEQNSTSPDNLNLNNDAKLPKNHEEPTNNSPEIKNTVDVFVEEKGLDLKVDLLRNIPTLNDQEKLLVLPKSSSRKVYQLGTLPSKLPFVNLDEPKALSPTIEPVASTAVTNTYGKKSGGTESESKMRAWNFFHKTTALNVSKPPLHSNISKKDHSAYSSPDRRDNDSIEEYDGDSPLRLPPKSDNDSSTRKITDFCKPTPINSLNWSTDDNINLSFASTKKYNKIAGDSSSTPLQDDYYSNRKSVGGIRNMGNTCYLSSILQALLANGSFCQDLTSEFWSHTEDIWDGVQPPVQQRVVDSSSSSSIVVAREGKENINPTATPSLHKNLFQSYAFESNINTPVLPNATALLPSANQVSAFLDAAAVSNPSSPLDTASTRNWATTVQSTKTAGQEERTRYSIYSCLRETIDVVSQKVKLSANRELGSKRLFYSSFSDRTINVACLKKAVEHFSHQFRGYRQQDAHEFLTDLLNLIHEEMTAIIVRFLDKLGSSPSPNRDSLADRTEQLIYSIGNNRPLPSSSSSSSSSSYGISSSSSSSKRKLDDGEVIVSRNEGSGNDATSQKAAERLTLVCHHFESTVQNSFSCISCGHQRQPKHETYRVFSIDIEYHKDTRMPHAPPHARDRTSATSSPTTTCSSINYLQSMNAITPLSTYFTSKKPKLNTILSDDEDNNNVRKKDSPALQLKYLFGNFFSDDIRDLVCERCHESNGRVRITSEITTLPTTLVIHLKRFRYEEATERYVKINTPVSFPMTLNLLDCGDCIKHRDHVLCQSLSPDIWNQRPREIKTSAADFESFFPSPGKMPRNDFRPDEETDPFFGNHAAIGTRDEKQQQQQYPDKQWYSYTLSAVVRHIGREMLTGHYICDAASSEPRAAEDCCDLTGDLPWKRYDDACVTDIDQDTVLEEQDTPYILFYTKSIIS